MARQRGPALTSLAIARRDVRDIRYYGARVGSDATAAAALSLAAAGCLYIPKGTWIVNNIELAVAGQQIQTDGYATIIQQDSGASNTTPIIKVSASDCIVGSMTLKGNISTSTLEFQHAVQIYGTADITNVEIGNLIGIDLRGDVLYMGANTGLNTTNIRFGRIVGRNVLRNVVSIVGACDVTGVAAVAETGCGYSACDIEPNTTTSTDIYVGLVKGGNLQCAPPLAANTAKRIHFGHVDLSGVQANSTPGYTGYTNQIKNGVSLRNTQDIRIDHLKLRDFTGLGLQYIYNVGETKGERISIGYIDAANCGSAETTYNAIMQVTNVKSVDIGAGEVVHQAVGDVLIYGDPTARDTAVDIGELRIDGGVVRFCKDSNFRRIRSNQSNVVTMFRDMTDSVVSNSEITCYNLASNVVNSSFVNCNVTASNAYIGGTSSNVRMPGSKMAGDVPSGTFTMPAAATTTVNNKHCRADSQVILQPNSSAGTALFNGAKFPYVASTSEGSFVVSTGNGTAAAGTETLRYYIL